MTKTKKINTLFKIWTEIKLNIKCLKLILQYFCFFLV